MYMYMETEGTPIIRLDGVSAGYDGKAVVESASFSVYERDFLGIIGPNGGGKTTLLKVMMGLIGPMEGSVDYFDGGRSVGKIPMGYLPQYSSIDRKFPISVAEVVESGLGNADIRRSVRRSMVAEAVAEFGLEAVAGRSIGSLSGGQLQRTMLARAVVSRPRVVLLDEPSTYIDQRRQEELYTLLGEINRTTAVVMVSHDVGTVLQCVKNVACVAGTVHYHPSAEITGEHLSEAFGCPIEILGHGGLPHRILKQH